jgi:hypothetical protein
VQGGLYALGLRGEFAALAGLPDWKGGYSSEPSPNDVRLLISTASGRKKSPFALFYQIFQEGQDGTALVEKELIPEIVKSVRSGFINLDAPEEDAISTSFASLVARRMIGLLERNGSDARYGAASKPLKLLMDALYKTTHQFGNESGSAFGSANHHITASPHWANELKVFLKLYSVKLE